ncbi:hypothetical protein FRB94_004827 [Tulasnella sp. JGI-2019a]|nr:hypothetical protein FRB93_002971 [Tulasnella sp. JGI-2019a]KAG9001334.1 hypothetical protein FRB94_004827 [Tulasnella sp. JGI-2019a]
MSRYVPREEWSRRQTGANDYICEICRRRPKLLTTDRRSGRTIVQPFCGRACAEEANNISHSRQSYGSRPEFRQADDYDEDEYDSGEEEEEDEEDEEEPPDCILCGKYPQADDSYFCGKRCARVASSSAPIILPVDEDDPDFRDIEEQFYESWEHEDKEMPTVQQVYKIIQTDELMERYESYRARVEREGRFRRKRLAPGNERWQWHGTRRSCDIGDDPRRTKLCGSHDCGVCGIVRRSFKLNRVGTARRPSGSECHTNFSRYGSGIYTSTTSSKSDDYSGNHERSRSPYKTMLLARVVIGRDYRTRQDMEHLTRPPSGYHSVAGEVGRNLNYPETVVYHEDAIRPDWLIVYE